MASYDFSINQGTDLTVPLVLKNSDGSLLNLFGYSCRMQVRRTKGAHCLVDDLSTQNGRIEIDSTEARIVIKFPNEVTSKYPPLALVYDIELVSASNEVTRILEGNIDVSAGVTRDESCSC